MQFNQLRPVLIGFFLLFSLPSICQNDITSGGGTLTTESGILSYSIGQVSYQVISSSQTQLSQGVQQAFEVSSILNTESIENEALVSVFPNPTTDYIIIQFENIPDRKFFIELEDSTGKLIYSKNILSKSSQIPFHSLSSGVYFLSLNDGDCMTQSFKIIKTR